jgi:hypothetical protein
LPSDDDGSPGSHPHSGRNWQPATTFDEYLQNCREGLEEYSDRRTAKLMGWSRMRLHRVLLTAELPDELFERLLAAGVGQREMALIAAAAKSDAPAYDVERCPHCSGVLRRRSRISPKARAVIREWLDAQARGSPRPHQR